MSGFYGPSSGRDYGEENDHHEPWCASRYKFDSGDLGSCDCRPPLGHVPHEPSAKELVVFGWPARERIAKWYAPPTVWARILAFLRR